MYGDRHLQNFVNSTGKFNSIVVKALKSVFCSSRDGVPLKFKKQTWRQYSSSIRIVWAWFWPLLNLAGQYLQPRPPTIGGHLVRYPWSAILDWAWYRNFRYRSERAESDIITDIGIKFYPISDIIILTDSHSSLVLKRSLTNPRGVGSILHGEIFVFFNVGYRNDLWCRYRNTSDIVMTFFSSTYLSPISE